MTARLSSQRDALDSARLPSRLHHHAYVCADQERTRRFYEDVIGLPLIGMWIEQEQYEGQTLVYSHAFYGLGDGSAVAFFNFADPTLQAKFTAKEQCLFVHLALAVTQKVQDEIRARLEQAGMPVQQIDHGYCFSIYVRDPDGLTVEFTRDPADAKDIEAWQSATAHESLARWMRGETAPNNTARNK